MLYFSIIEGIHDFTKETEIFFVTTGYLVRSFASNPDLIGVTHLIIDEVHERSVDGDIACYFAKRMLVNNPSIKVILMSATLEFNLFSNYFQSSPAIVAPIKTMFVGVKRFPVEIKYIEDLIGKSFDSHPLLSKICSQIVKEKRVTEISKLQYRIVDILVKNSIKKGTGVLIFVSGMLDILEIADLFKGDDQYQIHPVHSSLPLDDQLNIFAPTTKTKIVIATNAAESSITLPDIDVVICLGSNKALSYNSEGHRVQLMKKWISKASAIQRSGRTGRVRPGTAFVSKYIKS